MHGCLKVPLVTSARMLSCSESAHNLLSKCWLNAAVTGDAKMLFPREGNNNTKQSLSKHDSSILPNSLILTSLDIFTLSKKKSKEGLLIPEPCLGVKDKRLSLLSESHHPTEKKKVTHFFIFPQKAHIFHTRRLRRPAVDVFASFVTIRQPPLW